MNYSTKYGIELDDTPCNHFIRKIIKAVELFDVDGKKEPIDEKYVPIFGRIYSFDEPALTPDFNLPLVCFLKILEPDSIIVFHYAIINKTTEYEINPFVGPYKNFYDYLILCSYNIIEEPTKFLQEDFAHFYNILEKNNLLDLVETELEKIILLNA